FAFREFHQRKVNLESRAGPGFAPEGYAAFALLDYAVHAGKAKARPLAHGLGGEKGFENAGLHFRTHARARVAYAEHDIRSGRGLEMRRSETGFHVNIGGF